MTRRFDRAGDGRKIHTQTLCALSHLDFRQIGAHDYAQLFLLLQQLGLGPDGTRKEVFRRMTFNVAAAICDDHTKNFSFLLPEGDDWRLSPAYDVTHAHAPTSRWTRQHLMAVNGRTVGITHADVMQVGDLFAVPAASDVYEEVLTAIARWPTFADEAGVPEVTTEQISADIGAWSKPLLA